MRSGRREFLRRVGLGAASVLVLRERDRLLDRDPKIAAGSVLTVPPFRLMAPGDVFLLNGMLHHVQEVTQAADGEWSIVAAPGRATGA